MRTIELSVSIQVDDGLSDEGVTNLSREVQLLMWGRLSGADISGIRIRSSDISMMSWVAQKKPDASR